jgi:hypothetical protein
MALESVEFFGSVDRKDGKMDGRIVSEYPAFYFTTHIDELVERIASNKRAIDSGAINPQAIPELRAEIERDTKRLSEINKSHIKLTGKDKDEAATLYKHLADHIQDSMFCRSDMMKGLANPHDELKRRITPIIPVGKFGAVFKNMGIDPVKGKVSRTQASRVFKILGKVLEENTNTEHLRKDYRTDTFRPDVPLEQMI